MRKTRQQKNAERRIRRTEALTDAQLQAPEGKVAVRAFGEIAYVTRRGENEALFQNSSFTARQLDEIAAYGKEAHERVQLRKEQGKGYRGREIEL